MHRMKKILFKILDLHNFEVLKYFSLTQTINNAIILSLLSNPYDNNIRVMITGNQC